MVVFTFLLTRLQSFTGVGGDFNQLAKTDNPFSNRYAELDYSIFTRDTAGKRKQMKVLHFLQQVHNITA